MKEHFAAGLLVVLLHVTVAYAQSGPKREAMTWRYGQAEGSDLVQPHRERAYETSERVMVGSLASNIDLGIYAVGLNMRQMLSLYSGYSNLPVWLMDSASTPSC